MATTAYLKALGIGAVAGLRAMTAPAATLGARNSAWTGAARLLAFGEYVGDKLPGAPSRLSLPPLVARVVSGGCCGGIVAARLDASRAAGLACGVAGARGGAWAGYTVRGDLSTSRGVPSAALALAEDALAAWGGRLATTSG